MKSVHTRHPAVTIVLCLVIPLVTSGCAVLLLGAGAAGGYVLGKDSVRNEFTRSKAFVFQKSLDVAKEVGIVTFANPDQGIIHLTVQDTAVTITVKPIKKGTVELKIKARKNVIPNVDVAQDVYTQILKHL